MPFFSDRDRKRDLGHLEQSVMRMLWDRGAGSVRDVAGWLEQPLAYNTVMTTLDRLFKKGLLDRTKRDRSYFYSPRFSLPEWKRKQAEDMVARFLSVSEGKGELIVSCLLDNVEKHDAAFLDQLEARIKQKRRELEKRESEEGRLA